MNPALQALGLPEDARVLVSHLDDVGMNLGANQAWEACHRAGSLGSASVMMPCSWAPESLDRAGRISAEGLSNPDLGVHLTLTCEWDSYRWGPFGPGPRRLLTDKDGYLPRSAEEHLAVSDSPEGRKAVKAELKAQLEGALAKWPDITHIDSHMFVLIYPPNLRLYMDLAIEYRLPCMLPGTKEAWRPWVTDDQEAEAMAQAVTPMLEAGMPLFDRVDGVPLENPPSDRPSAVKQLIRDCVPGLNFLFLHANKDTPEARTIAADWKARLGDLEVFSDPSLADFINNEGIHLIGMRELRELMRR